MRTYQYIIQKLSIIFSLIVIGGCVTKQAPYISYSESNFPLRDTAVLIALDDRHPYGTHLAQTTITGANGKLFTYCNLNGCPYWVRAKQGMNTFIIQYQTDAQLAPSITGAGLGVTSKIFKKEVVIDMKPRHIYVARYKRQNDSISIDIEDMGENADYGIYLGGMYGDGKTIYKAKFE